MTLKERQYQLLMQSSMFLENQRQDGYGEGWNDYMARLYANDCMQKIIDKMYQDIKTNIEMIDTGFDTSFNVGYRKMKDEILSKLEQYYDDTRRE